MADFQNTLNMYPAIGVPGAFASVNPVVSTVETFIAGADLPIGGFCWRSANDDGAAVPTGSGQPLGFVVRNQIYPLERTANGAANIVPAGCAANVQIHGDFYIEAADDITVGQKVFAVLADGTITTGTAGSSITGAVETDWTVTKAAAEGEIAVISRPV